MTKLIRNGVMIGAAVGIGVAVVLITLDLVRPFPVFVDDAIEHLAFRLCPLYILGFANGMGSMTNVVIVTIIGNAILYGFAFGIIATMISPFRRLMA